MPKPSKMVRSYGIRGELPSGCSHHYRLTREQAVRLIGRYGVKTTWRDRGYRVMLLARRSGLTHVALPKGYRYEALMLEVLAERAA